jgi:CheY-like chemotaxis protein
MLLNPTSSMMHRRFALIGLSDAEVHEITPALSRVGAQTGRVFTSPELPGLNPLAPYDVCVVNGSAINAEGMVGGIAIASLQRRQVLTIVDEAELNNADFASPHLQREFLVRPIRIPELLARLADLVRKGEEKYSIPRVDASRRRVLIVDDDEIVRVLLSTILETAGFKCDCVSRASDALAALAGGHHDLVLLDVRMPEMDGFKVLEALRMSKATPHPAVVMVTSATGEEDLVHGLNLGADDYITKPFNSRELIARSQRAIRGRELANIAM